MSRIDIVIASEDPCYKPKSGFSQHTCALPHDCNKCPMYSGETVQAWLETLREVSDEQDG